VSVCSVLVITHTVSMRPSWWERGLANCMKL